VVRGSLTGFDGAGNVLLSEAVEDYLVDDSAWELAPPRSSTTGAGGLLPDGWHEKRDPASGGRPFYFNVYTCTAQWERPVAPHDGPVYRRVHKFSVA
jgi:small nuclear ribonucleoprotein (snRNP)-like protein